MGMHVKYECPGAVPIMSGNPLPPAEGDAHLVAIAISKKQGAQGRRFALLMPNDEKDSMFFVGLDGTDVPFASSLGVLINTGSEKDSMLCL